MSTENATVTHAFATRFDTAGGVDVITGWLTENVMGQWSIITEPVIDNAKIKTYTVSFADKADRALFRNRFTMPHGLRLMS